MESKSAKTVNGGVVINQVYDGTVKARAYARGGQCPNLNGHILEVMGTDKTNLNPVNIVKGVKETLTQSKTATTVDSVVQQGGKVIQRVQYKDAADSVGAVMHRVGKGDYHTATLKGTTETAKVFNEVAAKQGVAKRMVDTNISSGTTKSLARSMGAAKQVSMASALKGAAKSGGTAGAVISGGLSAVTNIIDVCNGEKDIEEAVGCVAKDTVGGGLAGAGAAAAATATGAAVASGAAALGITGAAVGLATVAAPLAVAVGVGCVISSIWDSLWD